jgi:mRNA-degrading endonuclease HigB of HigAB toxin-antitoxin module
MQLFWRFLCALAAIIFRASIAAFEATQASKGRRDAGFGILDLARGNFGSHDCLPAIRESKLHVRNTMLGWTLSAARNGTIRRRVKASYPKASILKSGRVVFNVKGNDYRLIARVQYQAGVVAIRFFGTHAEYDEINAEAV